jgi:hypothetical protein
VGYLAAPIFRAPEKPREYHPGKGNALEEHTDVGKGRAS